MFLRPRLAAVPTRSIPDASLCLPEAPLHFCRLLVLVAREALQ